VLGTFIVVDTRFKTSASRAVAQILVELDPSEGLYESMKLIVGDRTYVQLLDYLNVPFWCVRCHRVGHVVNDCDKNVYQEGLEVPPRFFKCASLIHNV
jgi:hypothetical protein